MIVYLYKYISYDAYTFIWFHVGTAGQTQETEQDTGQERHRRTYIQIYI